MNKLAILTLIVLSAQKAYSSAAPVSQKYKPKLSMVFEGGESAFGSAATSIASTPNAFDLRRTNFDFATDSRASNHPATPDAKQKAEEIPSIRQALMNLKHSSEPTARTRTKTSSIKAVLSKSSYEAQITHRPAWKPPINFVAKLDDRLKKLQKTFTFPNAFLHSKDDMCILFGEIKKVCENPALPQLKPIVSHKPAYLAESSCTLAKMAYDEALRFKKTYFPNARSQQSQDVKRALEVVITLVEKITKAA
jgi:hypothetical protein